MTTLKYILLVISMALFVQGKAQSLNSLSNEVVSVHFKNKKKKTVEATFVKYVNNRVTVLKGKNLHDYFYPEIKVLKFRNLSFGFQKNGKPYIIEAYFPKNNTSIDNLIKNAKSNSHKQLYVKEKFGSKAFEVNTNKSNTLVLKNGTEIKTSKIHVVNDSTLYANKQYIRIDEIAHLKGRIFASTSDKIIGVTLIAVGVGALVIVASPAGALGLAISAPALYFGIKTLGFRNFNLYDKWKLEVI